MRQPQNTAIENGISKVIVIQYLLFVLLDGAILLAYGLIQNVSVLKNLTENVSPLNTVTIIAILFAISQFNFIRIVRRLNLWK